MYDWFLCFDIMFNNKKHILIISYVYKFVFPVGADKNNTL